jgi:hypothetical protein
MVGTVAVSDPNPYGDHSPAPANLPQKLVVGFPFYRQLSVTWFFNFIGLDMRHVIGTVGIDGTILARAMERLSEMALDNYPDFDRLVLFEQDVLPPKDAFNRIASYRQEHDIVAPMTFDHKPPHHVMACMHVDPEPYFSPLTAEITRKMVEAPALYEVDAVATGFMSIRREVFEQWDKSVPMWKAAPPFVGHDLHMCNEAKKQGFKVWVDSGMPVDHLTQVPQAALAANPPEKPELWC